MKEDFMEDIRSVLETYRSRRKEDPKEELSVAKELPSTSEIPDLFFDKIIIDYKMSRQEIATLMYLYRIVWCRPNANQLSKHAQGISEMISLEKMGNQLSLTFDELYRCIHKLESFGFIEVIRSGQYFVRKYFTQAYDIEFGIHYENFF
jgi:hypothetical protein